ncbi:hypothetical protein CONPUDRAFT_141048 [Coniophora puteana RWD-64-598 SS2]|uniref:SAGA-associated factor 11 n=1 Tax=Coniophora puteana (strain RWD-64-598) TaxID=741705 RepID=A0A5M3N6P7_CONPW|nr:uncharacterized protein CONPUDRAFT_141048 [Coniophora puteana RWD-64-598 SS2]EIW86531.1 hypothetical protein CONPUDRAFT_141048 [Coniophora puteana RWD-64-598 SS2]
MSKAERDETINILASRLFSALLDDLTMDIALRAHHEVAKSRAVCAVCNTRCGMAHPNGTSVQPSQDPASGSHELSVKEESGSNAGTSVSADDIGNFECLVCKRKVAASRYAPHLSKCMGLGRRATAARGAVGVKTKAMEPGRSASPFLGSDAGVASDDTSVNGKGKGKSKSKRADEAEYNLKRKQPSSPQISPAKKQKKQKTTGSPVSRVKEAEGISPTKAAPGACRSQPEVPSELRSSSVTELDCPSPALTTPFTNTLATAAAPPPPKPTATGTGPPKRGRPKGVKTGQGKAALAAAAAAAASAPPPPPPPKRVSPPRPPPPARIEPNYLMDNGEGEETGSSTDTDSN